MNPNSFGTNKAETKFNGQYETTSNNSAAIGNTDQQINNISYEPSKHGHYNCFASSGYSKSNAVTHTPAKKLFALILLVGIVSSSFGFLGAMLAFKLSLIQNGSDLPASSDFPLGTQADAVINIVPNRPAVSTENLPYDERNKLNIAQVSASVLPSTVEIVTETAVYDNMFGSYVTEGAGSGVIISDSGYIVTNHHVVENARTITVVLSNGNEYKASVVGSDSDTDIAVLSISATEPLTAAVLGDSRSLSQGDEIVVVGNPLGSLGGSVTNGIISALDREITIDDKIMMLIQTNASVNPGNSGGGMFNMYGELVGLINARSSGDNIDGIGFAIPVNSVYNISSQIIEYGYVRGKIDHGLTMIEVENVWDMTRYNVSSTGVYIYKSEFSEELKSGDRISYLNGVRIDVYTDIKKALLNCKAGDTIKITVTRGAKDLTFDLTLKEYVPNDTIYK